MLIDPSGSATGTAPTSADLARGPAGWTSARPGGGNAGVNIPAPGQIASFTFSGTSGQKISAAVSGASAGLQAACYNVTLFRPDNTPLVGTTSCRDRKSVV